MMQGYKLFLLEGLSEDEVLRCKDLSDVEQLSYKKGEVIYNRNSVRRALAYVLEGRVRVCHGRVVSNELKAGDVFGAAAMYGSMEPYPSTVVAATDCRILLISQDTVSRWMIAVPKVGENYIRFLSDRIRFLNRRLSTLTAGQSDGKLWCYLQAHKDEGGVVSVSGGMTALAKRLDMGRSSLYRSLDMLIEAGRIRRSGKQIIILDMEE